MCNKHKKILTRRGFSLIEAVLTLGVLGFAGVVSMRISNMSGKADRGANQNFERIQVLNEIRAFLADPDNCTESFKGNNPNDVASYEFLRRGDGSESDYFSKDNKFGGNLLQLSKITYGGAYGTLVDTSGNPRLFPAWEPLDGTDKRGITAATFTFKRLGDAAGGKEITQNVRLFTVLTERYSLAAGAGVNTNAKLESCIAFSLGGSGFWKPTFNSDPGGIFYNTSAFGQNVGIGTDDPEQRLHVAGNTLVDQNITSTQGMISTTNGNIRANGNNGNIFANKTVTGKILKTRGNAKMEGNKAEASDVQAENVYSPGNNEFTINGANGTFPGDLRAGTLGVGSNYTETQIDNSGNLTCRTATATGNITAGTISSGGDTIVGGRAVINGTVEAKDTKINGTLEVTGNSLFDANVQVGDPGINKRNLYVSDSVVCSSDRRLKKNIKPLSNTLEKVLSLNSVEYEWKVDQSESPEKSYGFIAQEVEEIFPEIVKDGPSGYKSMSYTQIISLVVKSIQEQEEIIRRQEEEIRSLKLKIEELNEK